MKTKQGFCLFLWKNKEANPPIVINRLSELGKMVPDDIEVINISIVDTEHKITIDFDDKNIEDAELVKNIFAISWKVICDAGLLD